MFVQSLKYYYRRNGFKNQALVPFLPVFNLFPYQVVLFADIVSQMAQPTLGCPQNRLVESLLVLQVMFCMALRTCSAPQRRFLAPYRLLMTGNSRGVFRAIRYPTSPSFLKRLIEQPRNFRCKRHSFCLI